MRYIPAALLALSAVAISCPAATLYLKSIDDPDFYSYDTQTDAWTVRNSFTAQSQLATDSSGNLYVARDGVVKLYNPTSDTWSAVSTAIPRRGSIPISKSPTAATSSSTPSATTTSRSTTVPPGPATTSASPSPSPRIMTPAPASSPPSATTQPPPTRSISPRSPSNRPTPRQAQATLNIAASVKSSTASSTAPATTPAWRLASMTTISPTPSPR